MKEERFGKSFNKGCTTIWQIVQRRVYNDLADRSTEEGTLTWLVARLLYGVAHGEFELQA